MTSSLTVKAEGVSSLLEVYDIEGTVSAKKVHEKLNDLQTELDTLNTTISDKSIKEGAYNDFIRTYTAFLESTDEELRLIEIDLAQAELLMIEKRNASLEEILKLDSTYRSLRRNYKELMDKRNLLSQQFNNVKAVKVTTEELEVLETTSKEYEDVKGEYSDLLGETDLGEIVGRHPVDNQMYITSTFGWRSNPFNGKGLELHKGVDFRGITGTPVLAKFTGTVLKVGHNDLSGNYVWLDHGGSVQTVYSHLNKITVAKDQVVLQYDTIGELGTTGRSTGPHLHFGLYINGEAVDPMLTIQ